MLRYLLKRSTLSATTIFTTAAFLVMNSCQKGEPEQFPDIAAILVNTVVIPAPDNLTLKVDDQPEIVLQGLKRVELFSGQRRFVFSESGQALLDTLVDITPQNGNYILFRPGAAYPYQLIDNADLGLDTVSNPRENFIKIRLANYSKQLRKEVDVVFLLTTYIGGEEKQVEAGSVLNVPASGFSAYHEILLGKNSSGNTSSRYTVQIKDATSKEILQSDTVRVNGNPYVFDPNSADAGQSVFIAYLIDTDGSCNTQDCRLILLNNLTAR